jgi:hypothetical protein
LMSFLLGIVRNCGENLDASIVLPVVSAHPWSIISTKRSKR